MSTKLAALTAIQGLQAILENPEVKCTKLKEYTDHFFAPGIYVRTIFIPAGMLLVGRRHRHEAINLLLKGTVAIINEHGEKIMAEAPLIFTSKPGQKAGYSITDVWYATVHPNPYNINNIDELEREMLYPEEHILEVVQ
jgi:hypothetical protein